MPKQRMPDKHAPDESALGFTRRGALAGGSAAGLILLSSAARAQTAPLIRKFGAARWAKDIENAVVYRNESEYASHPYVRGFWETPGGHLICNFSLTKVDYAEAARGNPNLLRHTSLINSPGGRRGVTVRSEDRGRTWKVTSNDPRRPSNDVMAPRIGIDGRPGGLSEIGPVDFTNKDVLVSNFNYMYIQGDPLLKDFYADLKTIVDAPEHQVFFRVSKDAGRSWSRSAMLPRDNMASLSAVESSLVRPDGRCLLFLNGSTQQPQGNENSPQQSGTYGPLVYCSTEDGTDFHFLSFVAPDRGGGPAFVYPRGIALANGRLLCVLRRDRDWSAAQWTEIYASDDGGGTWQFLSRATDFGAPSAPVLLSDGRLVLVYGRRMNQPGIRAVVSEDGGKSWSPEIIVRNDAGSWDIGYPRAWEVSPGRIGVVYYYNTKDDPVQVKNDAWPPWGLGGVRFLARSFFSID